jgi:hypothetical protein
MKRMLMVVALIAATTTPALGCHHFRVWHYPWPQRCVVGYAYLGHEYHSRVDRLGRPPAPLPPVGIASATSGPPSEQAAKPSEARASGATPAPATFTPSFGSAPASQASPSAAPAPGPSAPTEAQAKSSSTPQPAPAGPPLSAEKGSDKPKVNDVPVNPLD